MDHQIIKIIFTLFFTSTTLILYGQQDCKCCSEKFHEFDFWIGNWEVFDSKGNKVGDNEIKTIENGCALMERWRGLRGGTGTSLNYYNKQDSTWNQVWVSSSSAVLKLKGSIINDSMILKGEPFTMDSVTYYNQIKWTKIEESVKQEWEVYDSSGNLKHKVFIGIYIKTK